MADKIITDPAVIEQIRNAMPEANGSLKGLASQAQGITNYAVKANSYIDIVLPVFGLYTFTCTGISGFGMIFQKTYNVYSSKVVLDPNNIQTTLFKVEQLEEGSSTVRVTSLRPDVSNLQFSVNRI